LKRSNRLVLLIGVFLAIVAFVGIAFILQSPGGSSGTPAVPTTAMTVIATRDIPLGVPVKANMLKTEVRNLDERKPNAFTSPELVIGSITRKPITNGAQLSAEDFDGGGGEILDLQVPPGMRAIAVSVDQISGVGTVIKTGDYVDMLVAITGADKFPVVELDPQTDTITVVQGVNSTSIKLLLQGMQVIGTLLPTPTTAQTAPAEGAPVDQTGTTLSDQSEIVILAVTAQQAEVIQFAKTDGLITLALRSASDFVDENGQPIVAEAAGTTGVVLKTLIDGGYGVIKPEVIEAILPTQ
jgi:pilus assembly protein CpaB